MVHLPSISFPPLPHSILRHGRWMLPLHCCLLILLLVVVTHGDAQKTFVSPTVITSICVQLPRSSLFSSPLRYSLLLTAHCFFPGGCCLLWVHTNFLVSLPFGIYSFVPPGCQHQGKPSLLSLFVGFDSPTSDLPFLSLPCCRHRHCGYSIPPVILLGQVACFFLNRSACCRLLCILLCLPSSHNAYNPLALVCRLPIAE